MIGQSQRTRTQWLVLWGCWTAALLFLFVLIVGVDSLIANWHLSLLGAMFLGGVGVVALDVLETRILTRDEMRRRQ